MFTTREIFCGNCGCKNFGVLNKKKLKIRCSNKCCDVSIVSTFKSDDEVVSNYRHLNGQAEKFTGIYCEHCNRKHSGYLNTNGEFRVVCDCVNSIYVKKQANGDLKTSNKFLYC